MMLIEFLMDYDEAVKESQKRQKEQEQKMKTVRNSGKRRK